MTITPRTSTEKFLKEIIEAMAGLNRFDLGGMNPPDELKTDAAIQWMSTAFKRVIEITAGEERERLAWQEETKVFRSIIIYHDVGLRHVDDIYCDLVGYLEIYHGLPEEEVPEWVQKIRAICHEWRGGDVAHFDQDHAFISRIRAVLRMEEPTS